MSERNYPALARLVADSNGSKHHLAELTELADAERMAQPAPCGKLEHSGTLTFSGARGPECLLCSQSAEIERLREQIRELESQIADPSLVRALMIPRDSQSELAVQRALLTRLAGALEWSLRESNDFIEVGGSFVCIHCNEESHNERDSLHIEDCPLHQALKALAEARAAGVVTE